MGADGVKGYGKEKSYVEALDRALAVIEFDVNGVVQEVNQNFLYALGYTKEEIIGQHHRLFCDPEYVLTDDYRKFWFSLGQGNFESGQYCRFSKSGKQVWIQASYNPIFDSEKKVIGVVKFATVITEQKVKNAEYVSINQALQRSQAVIEFELDGTILTANDNFLQLTGYRLSEIQGKHHRIFCEQEFINTTEYKEFWSRLGKGEFESGEYRRFGKGGAEVWIQATYNPVFDSLGKPSKIIKFASDITAMKVLNSENQGNVNAISRSQAVIEFDLTGKVLTANANFLSVTGYNLDEVVGRHHRMFCHDDYIKSAAYEVFWDELKSGKYHDGTFKRKRKDGQDVWIKATYNPIFDLNGNPLKVVKFAMDVTQEKKKAAETEGKITAIKRSQAVIEFNLDGSIIDANDIFLSVMGYTKEQVAGQHHKIFCQENFVNSAEYLLFWNDLGKGNYKSGEFLRRNSKGDDVWILASYNPILDEDGKPFKILKIASDITFEKQRSSRIEESGRSITDFVGRLTKSSTEIASAAFESEQVSNKNKDQADVGLKQLKEVIESSIGLEKSAHAIAVIVQQIKEISDLTNLLAFNATIEAVRAGDLGRGFSVVADEVRKLADRSANSAKQIDDLITTTLDLTKKGRGLSSEAVTALEEIHSGVRKTAGGVAVIGEATNEQNALAEKIKVEIDKISMNTKDESSTTKKNIKAA